MEIPFAASRISYQKSAQVCSLVSPFGLRRSLFRKKSWGLSVQEQIIPFAVSRVSEGETRTGLLIGISILVFVRFIQLKQLQFINYINNTIRSLMYFLTEIRTGLLIGIIFYIRTGIHYRKTVQCTNII